jgi:hypothetical protein
MGKLALTGGDRTGATGESGAGATRAGATWTEATE